MPTVALVTTTDDVLKGEEVDIDIIVSALHNERIVGAPAIWHDPSVGWDEFDLILIRSPWDYPERLAEFLGWLDARAAHSVVLNPAPLIKWNLDKRYMRELEREGVAVVPSWFASSVEETREAMYAVQAGQVIIKPTISVGSRDTGRYSADDPAALNLAEKILGDGKQVVVQPAIESVAERGEHGLVHFDGEYSHALRKGAILADGGGYLGGAYTEDISAATPSDEEVALAHDAMVAIATIAAQWGLDDPRPLYARLDIVRSDAGPQLLEAELFEPSYFLGTAPGSEVRFAKAVRNRLEALGAG